MDLKRTITALSRPWAIGVVLVLAMLTACAPPPRLVVVGAGTPSLDGAGVVKGSLSVNNGGPREFVVESGTLVVKYRGRELGTLHLAGPVAIPVGEGVEANYEFSLENLKPAALGSIQLRMLTDPDQITVDVTGRVKWGAGRRKIALKNVSVTKIIAAIGSKGTK